SGNRAAVIGIENNEVGVGAGLDGALAGKEVELLGDGGAGDVDEGVEVDAAAANAVGVEEVDAFLEGRDAVGNLREVVTTHWLLGGEVERGVVGGDGLDETVAEGVPENGLV